MSASSTYRASPTKRRRGTKGEMQELRDALYAIVAEASERSTLEFILTDARL